MITAPQDQITTPTNPPDVSETGVKSGRKQRLREGHPTDTIIVDGVELTGFSTVQDRYRFAPDGAVWKRVARKFKEGDKKTTRTVWERAPLQRKGACAEVKDHAGQGTRLTPGEVRGMLGVPDPPPTPLPPPPAVPPPPSLTGKYLCHSVKTDPVVFETFEEADAFAVTRKAADPDARVFVTQVEAEVVQDTSLQEPFLT